MDSIDLEVLKVADAWIADGQGCELVTVIKTWGSSPRPAGAMMVIHQDGRVIGSVSGGCIEDDLIEGVQKNGVLRTLPELVTYGISATEAHRFGLPCGGTIELLIEPLSGKSGIGELLQRVARNELTMRRLDRRNGLVTLAPAIAGATLNVSHDVITTVHGPRWRLLIIGAGQLSQFLAQIARGLDYQVTVCDPREEYRLAWQVADIDVVHAMPDDLVVEMQLDQCSAVVALTHDPKLDDLALMEALKSDAFYIGAIGSRINNARRRERLKEFDLSDAQLQKLHGPVGIYIGSKTPPEIAISILAEMTAIRNGVVLPATINVKQAKDASEMTSASTAYSADVSESAGRQLN